jgi:hypothetical protein
LFQAYDDIISVRPRSHVSVATVEITINLGVGELRPDVSFPVSETGEFQPDNILAVG